jgi:hypothetical protein
MKAKKNWADLRTCVSPEGRFVFGLHTPHFETVNLRKDDFIAPLGEDSDGRPQMNHVNFPQEDVCVAQADAIYEVANALPFRGTTFINTRWANKSAEAPEQIRIPMRPDVSLTEALGDACKTDDRSTDRLFERLPAPLQVALAVTSTDARDLVRLAQASCRFSFEPEGNVPTGLQFETNPDGVRQPAIINHRLFEAVANNPALPDAYKRIMVLQPGIQGDSPIVGQWRNSHTHVFEYLRANSYIPWGHYAANMAHDTIRYDAGALTPQDIFGMRHLYYQRTYVRLARDLGLDFTAHRRTIPGMELERLRIEIARAVRKGARLPFTATLWGWNYGFGYAASGYRLHASHQQIHQQFALIPQSVPEPGGAEHPAFACGDMIDAFIRTYRQQTGIDFFDAFENAIHANQRMDDRHHGPQSLIVYSDDNVLLFVPKAQTSQWELQLMPKQAVGNIIDADEAMRRSLDKALLIAMRILRTMGATMITVFEYSKRFHTADSGQRLLYTFMPRLPESPGAFSEAQLRWINGHFPEDFAQACRLQLDGAKADLSWKWFSTPTPTHRCL